MKYTHSMFASEKKPVARAAGSTIPFVPIVALVCGALLTTGCIQRRIRVTSEPRGALVWLNDREIGRTPVETRFTFHGKYDVRLEKPGFEPVHAMRHAKAPVHEWPGVDLVATALPVKFDNTIEWHFDLEPKLELRQSEAELEQGLVNRADAMRARAEAIRSEPIGRDR